MRGASSVCPLWPRKREFCSRFCSAVVGPTLGSASAGASPGPTFEYQGRSPWLVRVRVSSRAKGLRALRQTIEGIGWRGGQRPALLDPDRKTVQWDQVCSEMLPRVMAKYDMICSNRHITEILRREHEELVVERPWRKAS